MKKQDTFPSGTAWMGLIVLNELSQSERQAPHDSTYTWSLVSKLTSKREADSWKCRFSQALQRF